MPAVLLIRTLTLFVTKTLAFYSFYTEEELLPLMCKIASLVVKTETGKLTAISTKYASSKFLKISTIPQLKSERLRQLAAQAQDK